MQQGRFVKVAVNHEVVQLLSEKGTCVDRFEDSPDYDGCIYDKLKKLMNDNVGCTVPWLPDKSNICHEDTKASLAFDIYQKNRRNQKDICATTCHFTNMYFSPMVTGYHTSKDRSWAVFYFRRDIKTTNEYFLYSILSMAAEIGAYVGLLLGASLANLGMINSYLIDRFFGKGKERISPEPTNISVPSLKIVTEHQVGLKCIVECIYVIVIDTFRDLGSRTMLCTDGIIFVEI